MSVAPGQRTQGKLGTFYLADGTAVDIPLFVVRGKKDGPKLWIGAAMHGQELSGIAVIWEVLKRHIDLDTLCGTVVGAPLLNPFSFNGRTYFTPEDGYNVNRVFPGDPNGPLTYRLAHLIYKEGVEKCDYLIDLHCNVQSAMYFSLVRQTAHEGAWRKSCAMADAFGITTIQMILRHEAHRLGTLPEAAGQAGKPVLLVELVPWRSISPEAVRVGVRGVMNVMKSVGMIDGSVESQLDIHVINGPLTRIEVNVTRGGLVNEEVNVGDEIKKGQRIGQVVDVYGEPVEDIVSPVDGWLLAWPMFHNQAAGTGDHVAFVAFRPQV
jgi:predicted deacylase